MRPCKLHKIAQGNAHPQNLGHFLKRTNVCPIGQAASGGFGYFSISIDPPAPSIADFAFPLIAFTLKGIFDFSSPVPSTLTRSVLPINPLIYRFSGVNSVKLYFSTSWSI